MTEASTTSAPELTDETLLAGYTALICDLDGVVYRGPVGIPGAVEALRAAVDAGAGVVFATNNASRPADDVAAHLTELGLAEGGWSVVTSSQAAADYLAERLPAGSTVLGVGGPGVSRALTDAGLRPVTREHASDAAAVVQGLGVNVDWTDLATVARLAQSGLPWVATNLDIMLPTADGPAPGNGSLVAAVRAATDAEPHVVGKPEADLYEMARKRLGAEPARTLAIGDRLDTDIAGAHAAGIDSLVVFTGAAGLRELALAEPALRPTYAALDLRGLLAPPLRLSPGTGPVATIDADGLVRLPGRQQPPVPGTLDGAALRTVLGACWAAVDAGRPPADTPEQWSSLEARLGLS